MVANRWPKEMPVLNPRDFQHGMWATAVTEEDYLAEVALGKLVDEATPRELEMSGCGTACCLVGHVRHAFGLPADPSIGGRLPVVGEKFLRTLCDNLGRPIDPAASRVGRYLVSPLEIAASNAFEGHGGLCGNRVEPEQAAKAWAKTLKDFGYTENA